MLVLYILSSQKEVLKKVGCPPGQNTFYYNLVKSLLERVAPVMIDSSAVLHLVKLVDELITGRGPLADLVDNAPSKGIKLLLVSCHRKYFPFFISSKPDQLDT